NTGLSLMPKVFQLPYPFAIVGRLASVFSVRGHSGEAAFRLILLAIGFCLTSPAIWGPTGRASVAASCGQSAPQSDREQSVFAAKNPARDISIGEAGQSRPQQQSGDRSDSVLERFVQEGISIEFSLTRVSGQPSGSSTLVENNDVEFKFRITDAASGTPLKG